jgi:hypothetical protein
MQGSRVVSGWPKTDEQADYGSIVEWDEVEAGRRAEEARGCPCWAAEQFDPECPLHGREEFREREATVDVGIDTTSFEDAMEAFAGMYLVVADAAVRAGAALVEFYAPFLRRRDWRRFETGHPRPRSKAMRKADQQRARAVGQIEKEMRREAQQRGGGSWTSGR